MSRYIMGKNREQMRIEPLCFDEMMAEDNPVRAIDAIVESMELSTLGFAIQKQKKPGANPTTQRICSNSMPTAILTESVPHEK